jgi:hypothetical protein
MITKPHSTRWLGTALTCRTLTLVVALLGLGHVTAMQPGTVTSWGENVMPLVQPGTRYAAIAAGGSHTLALRSNNTVLASTGQTVGGGSGAGGGPPMASPVGEGGHPL